MALEDTLNVNLNLPEIAPSSSPTEAFDREFSQVNKGITFNNPQPIIGPAVPDTTPDSININENLVGNFQTGPSPGVKNTSGGTIDFVKAVNSYMGQADVWAKDKYKYGRTYSYGAGHRNMNFERYYNHPQFEKLGFSPYRNNEQLYNENSSWMDDFRRMGTQYGKLFAAGFGSSLFLVDDDEAAEAMEKGMAIGSSSKEGVGAWITNFGLNSAYTMGIMTEIVIEDIGLAALEGLSLGTATPLVGAELARQGMLLGKGIKAVEKTKDALKALTDLNKAKELWNFGKLGEKTVDFAKAVNPLQRTFDYTANLAKNTNSFDKLSNVAKTTKGFGAFYRDIREISLAVEEGGMEAAMASNEYHQRLIDEYYAENGTMPEGKAAQDIYEKANSVRASVQMWNNLVIYGSNKLTIGKLLDGFPAASTLVKGLEDTTTRTLGKVARKEVLQKGAYEFAEKTFAKKAKDFVTKSPYLPWTLPYITGNLSEALQENAQEAIQKGVISYYDKIDKDPSQAGFWEGINHMGAALGTQWSGEGLNTFMSGFLMGSLAGGVQGGVFKAYQGTKSLIPAYKAEFEKAKQTAIEREDAILNAANTIAKDAMNVGQHNADRMAAARNHAADMNNAVEEQDEYKYNNAKDNLASENFYTLASTGKMNLITDHFDGMLKASDEELAEAYGKKPEDAPDIRRRLETLKERANSFQKKYDTAVKELPNPNDPSLFDPKKQPELYREVLNKYNAWNEAVRSVVISTEAAERISGRIINIATEFSRVSPWIETRKGATMSNTAGVNDAMAFIDKELRGREIATLRSEIEALKDGTPEQIAQSKLKERKLKSYEAWSNLLNSVNRELLNERKGAGDKVALNDFIDQLYQQFNEHIQIVAEETGGSIKDKEADRAFKKIVDFYMLETDSQQLTKAINILSNPQYFSRYYQAQQTVQAKRVAERDKSLREAHAKYVELAKTNDFLNELYDLGLFILPEEIDDFKKDPESVTYFDKNNKKPVEPTDAVYEKIKDILKRHFPKEEVKVEEKAEVKPEEKKKTVEEPAKPKAPKVVTPNITLEQLDQIPALKTVLIKLFKNQFVRESKGLTDEQIFVTPKFKNFIQTSGVALDQINKYNLANTTQTAKTEDEVEVIIPEEIDETSWKALIDKAVSEKELDKIRDQIDAAGLMSAGLMIAVNKKRDALKITPVVEEVTGEVPPEVAARIDLVSKFGLDQAEVDKMTTDQVLEKYAELTEEAPVSDRKTEIENKIKSIEDEIGSLNYFIGGTDSYAATVQAEKDIKRLEEDIKKLKEELAALERAKPAESKVEVISENYTPELLRANPDKLFLFGDNNARTGKGGQAIIRDEPNAAGISTKLLPKNTPEAFMSDDQLADNKAVIDSDIKKAKDRAAKEGKTIVLPKGGFGTGLAALATKAPQTFAYLNQRLQKEFGFNNTTGELVKPEAKPVIKETRVDLNNTDKLKIEALAKETEKNNAKTFKEGDKIGVIEILNNGDVVLHTGTITKIVTETLLTELKGSKENPSDWYFEVKSDQTGKKIGFDEKGGKVSQEISINQILPLDIFNEISSKYDNLKAVEKTPETSKEAETIAERTYYQGSAEKTDEREFNYFTTSEEEAKDYGGKVRAVKVESNNPLNYYANKQVVDEFNAQNQGQVPEEFRGKLVYATPGAGKTTLSKTNKNIVDTDQLIIEEMAKMHPDFTRNTGETDQEFIGRYTRTYIRAKATVNQNVRNRIDQLKAEGKTILTGTLQFADQVDAAFSLKKDDPRLLKRFSSTKEINEFFAKEKEAFDNADKEIKKLEKPLESLFTTAKRFDILDNSPEGLATQEAFFRFVKAKGYDAIDFSTPGQTDSLYLVSLTNEIIKPAEKKAEEVKEVKKEEVKQQVVATPVLISALDELNSIDEMNEFFGDLLANEKTKEKYGLSGASNAVILKLQSESRKRFFKKKDFRSAIKGTVGILATGEKFVITNKSKDTVKYRILDQDNFPTGEEKTLGKDEFKNKVDVLYKDGMELQEGLFEQVAQENKEISNENAQAASSTLTKEKIEKALKDSQTMSKEERLKKLKDNLGCKQ